MKPRTGLVSLLLTAIVLHIAMAAAAQTADGWRQDIDLLVAKIERYHPRPWAKISRAEFLERAAALKRDLGEWDREKTFIEVKRLVASLQDGHTEVLFTNQERFNLWFPARIERFADGIFLTAADSLHADFLGGQVVRIGAVGADEAFRRVAEIVPRDSEHGVDRFATDYLANAVILKQLAIIDDEGSLELIVLAPDGRQRRARFQSAPWSMRFHWSWNRTGVPTSLKTRSVFDDRLDRLPLHLENVVPSRIPYAFEYLPDDRMLYFQFNAVTDWKKDPFRDFTRRMFQAFDEHAASIDKFVIDLRFNEGGNGYLLPALVKEFVLREPALGPDKLFIITGRRTFSAAPNLIGRMLECTPAITVGDIASGPLNWCSDTQEFLLPNSRLVVSISTMSWQQGHPTDDRGYYPPDCYLPEKFRDCAALADPALEAIKNGTARSLRRILVDQGTDAFVAEVERRKSLHGNVQDWFPYTSFDLVRTAYFDLAASGKIDDALGLARWNAELRPTDFWALYGWAEIAKEAERTAEALGAYRRLFALEPDLAEAVGDYQRLLVLDAYDRGGTTGLASAMAELKERNPPAVIERTVNALGYKMLEAGRTRDAIEVFAANVRAHPASANAYDSLGEAYLKAGEKDQARQSYEKSLALNPANADARKALAELGAR